VAGLLSELLPSLRFAAGFLGGCTASFVVKAAASLSLIAQACVPRVAISSIIVLVPGVGITLGVLIIHGNLVAGSSRLVGGLGIVIGWHLAAWYNPPPLETGATCPDQVVTWFLFLFIPVALCGWCILLDCQLKHWPFYWIPSLISGGVLIGLKYAQVQLLAYVPVLVAAVVVGIYGSVFSPLSGIPSFGVVLIGVFNILPDVFF
jgi:hypothetical protein